MNLDHHRASPDPGHRHRLVFDLLAACAAATEAPGAADPELALARRLEFHPAAAGQQRRSLHLVQDGTLTWLEFHPRFAYPQQLHVPPGGSVEFEFKLDRWRDVGLRVEVERSDPDTMRRSRPGTVEVRVSAPTAPDDVLRIVVQLVQPTRAGSDRDDPTAVTA